MPSIYGVRLQPIDGDVSLESLEQYGEVVDLTELMSSDDRGRDFCDGQTSPLPPNHADDKAGMLWTYSRDTADYWSGVVRRDVAERVAEGVINVPGNLSWLGMAGVSAKSAAAAESVLSTATLPQTIREVREAGTIAATVTDSQIQTQIQAYVTSTGNAMPTVAELVEWIKTEARWYNANV